MLSLSDVSKFIQGSPGIERFKPWWERGLDMLIVGLFMSLIMIWGRSVLVESFGMICINIEDNASNLPTNDMRFVASVCQQHSSAMTFVSYPYILLLQWLILVISQNLWLKIPAISARLDTFEGMINDLLKVDPIFITDTSNNQMLPRVEYDDDALPKIKVLNDKFMFILRDSSYVAEMYKWKTILQNIISIIFLLFTTLWIFWIGFFKVDFACNVPQLRYFSNSMGSITKQPFDSVFACSLGPSIYLYCTMIVHIFSLALILFLNIWSLYWFLFTQMSFADRTNIFGESKDDCKGLPGMADLQFCLALLSYNLHDGNYSLEVVKRLFQSKESVSNQLKSQNFPKFLNDTNKVKGFEDGCFMVIYLLNELNLYEIPNSQDVDHLFVCFEEIFKSLNRINLHVTTAMRHTIVEEMSINSHKYRHLFNSWSKHLFKLHENKLKQLIPNDCFDFQTYINLLKDEKIFGDHLCLMVAAEFFKVRIVLLRPAGDKCLPDDYVPFDKEPYVAIFILTYLPPLHFHTTKNNSLMRQGYEQIDEQQIKVRRFIEDEKYRLNITEQALRYASAPNDEKEADVTTSMEFQNANTLHTIYANKLKQKINQQKPNRVDMSQMGRKRQKDSAYIRKPNIASKSSISSLKQLSGTNKEYRRFSFGSGATNDDTKKNSHLFKKHSVISLDKYNIIPPNPDCLSMVVLFNEESHIDPFDDDSKHPIAEIKPLKRNKKVNFFNI